MKAKMDAYKKSQEKEKENKSSAQYDWSFPPLHKSTYLLYMFINT
jgi:hypothetical protein